MEKELKACLTSNGFNELFDQHLAVFQDLPQTKVYEITEQVHERDFGGRRYSSFDSFRHSRKSFLKGL